MSSGKWDYLVCDEASQITLPAAVMSATFAARSVFAGDPEQLAPVVQNPEKSVQDILTKTAFNVFRDLRVRLNEQSRMCVEICDAVSSTFYNGDLKVCAKARNDPDWKKERDPWYVNGREMPRIMFDERADEAKWSPKYNGFIRFGSAKIVEAIANELLGSYVGERDILVLTPFRAQRALIRALFKSGSLRAVRVSTVHRAQGSESKIVVFDPVDATSSFLNSKNGRRLINVAISRAQAHVIVVTNKKDRQNPWLARIQRRSEELWHTKGSFAEPLSFRI
jgi:superfamily I DNA and/or RNA helicase